ncbi:D-lyxose/D-mannose family sugar isomerase [Ruegeria sp. HKCCA4008]
MRISLVETVLSRRLGWNITNYAQGRFDEHCLFPFTLHNG